jgi:pilus assembly protein CpaF
LKDGARVNIVLNPVALNGPIVTIRRFPEQPIKMPDLLNCEALSPEMAEYLEKAVKQGESIIVSGGTGSGKTTFLNVLSNFIPSHERIITIEDSAELQIKNVPNIVKLETRGANVEGCREITIRELIKSALRMRPDRIVVGEVRGAEAVDLLQAMNTGHPGSMSTLHANSAKDMTGRLETMVLMGMSLPLTAIRKQIASGIQLVIQLGRLGDSSRRVLEIAKLAGIRKDDIVIEPVFQLKEVGSDSS